MKDVWSADVGTGDAQLREIDDLIQKHEDWRSGCLNMIASENLVSPAVRCYALGDLYQRYGCYFDNDPADREYRGNRYIASLEIAVQRMAREGFEAQFADLRPIGGHLAGVAALLGLTKPGDVVMDVSVRDWGHGLIESFLKSSLTEGVLRYEPLPVDGTMRTVDPQRLRDACRSLRPRLIVLGSSGMLFPDPVSDIVEVAHDVAARVVYDASHVMGLIGGGVFPNPLAEGADALLGSTHKTLFGPQGGIVLTNVREIHEQIGRAISPALVTSHHVYRLPSLAAAFAEVIDFGRDYGRQTVANSQRLAKALVERGFNVCGAADCGYTQTHIVLVDVSSIGTAQDVTGLLERAQITSCAHFETQREIRLGTAELTRRGMAESEMETIAELVGRVCMDHEPPEQLAPKVAKLAAAFPSVAFAHNPAHQSIAKRR